MATRALVTGGAGLIGSHLADLLLERGFEVTVLDSLEPDTHRNGTPAWVPEHVHFIDGDVRDAGSVRAALQGVEMVFHQAAYGGFSPSLRRTAEINVMGTITLLDCLRETRQELAALVVASSQAIYGEGAYFCAEHGQVYPGPRPLEQLERAEWEMRCPHCGQEVESAPTPETKPASATLCYSISKYFQERVVLGFGSDTGTHVAALRYSLTYGPRQSLFNPYTGITSIFSSLILNDKPPIVYEDGRQTRDFVFVEDVARANLHVAETAEAAGEVFNVGTGKATAVGEYARMLARAYDRDLEPELPGRFRPADVRHLYADVGRLGDVGFAATVPLEEGVRRYVEWIEQQGDVREHFSDAYERLQRAGIVRAVRPEAALT